MVKQKKKTRNPRWSSRKKAQPKHDARVSTVVHRKKASMGDNKARFLSILRLATDSSDPRLKYLDVAVEFALALNKAGLPYEQMAALASGPNILVKRVADMARNPGTLLGDAKEPPLGSAIIKMLASRNVFLVEELAGRTSDKLLDIEGFEQCHLEAVRAFLKWNGRSLAGEK